MYVDSAGLSRYRQDFGAWARRSLIPKDAAAARVRTEKAGAVSFVPVQETPLDVSVDFLFSETPPASGDKSPSNPSTISGVSSVKATRCGKNLCSNELLPGADVMRVRGINASYDSTDGSWVLKGTAVTNATPYLYLFTDGMLDQYPDALVRGKTYTFSIKCSDANVSSQVLDSIYADQWGGDGSFSAYCYANSSLTHTMLSDGKSFIFRLLVARGATVDTKVYVQVEEGSTATAFEPYVGTNYTLPLGSTYYGGTVDLATGVMTVTYYYVEINAVSAASAYNGEDYIELRYWPDANASGWDSSRGVPRPKVSSGLVCDKLIYGSTGLNCAWFGGYNSTNRTEFIWLRLDKNIVGVTESSLTIQQVRSKANDYLIAHPIKMLYELYTPYTVQLSPTEILSLTQSSDCDPRVNTVYSDAQAVQVGYLKHPSAASADLRNAVVSLGGGV